MGLAVSLASRPRRPGDAGAPAPPSPCRWRLRCPMPRRRALPPAARDARAGAAARRAAADSAGPAATPTAPAAPVPLKPKKKPPPPPPPLETALSTDPTPTFQPDTFFATAKAAERYARSSQAGGWPTDIVAAAARRRRGRRSPSCASASRSRAISTSEPVDGPAAQIWDKDLTEAVKRFQARMGLRQTGIVAGATLKAINVPAEVRRRQLAASAQRLVGLQFRLRRPLCRRQSALDLGRGGRERAGRASLCRDRRRSRASLAGDRRAHLGRSISTRPGRCRSRSSRKRSSRRCSGTPAISRARRSASSTAPAQEIDPKAIDWTTESRGQLHAAAGFGRGQFARHDPHRHAQQARRLYARHALEAAVRRRLSLP